MLTKLTLNMQEEIVKQAKDVTRRNGKSLSKAVEEFFKTLIEADSKKESYVKAMSGSLKNSTLSLKEAKGKYLSTKHGA